MDALLYRPWWEEEEFARLLSLPIRAVRQVLRLLETHMLVAREHRKEKKRQKERRTPPRSPISGDVVEENNQEKGLLISYSSLDYQRFYDMARFRIFKMRRTLKDELEDRRAIQEYACGPCGRTYTSLQAPFLIKPDGLFHCEECNTVLETAGDPNAGELSRKDRSKLVKAKQAKLEEELKPLLMVLAEIENQISRGDQIPDFGTLAAWAKQEAYRSGQSGKNSGAAAALQPQININLQGPSNELAGGISEELAVAEPRELPPWLQKSEGSGGGGSLSQDADGPSQISSQDTKESQAEYMRQYKQRLAAMAAQEEQNDSAKRQKIEGGWQEAEWQSVVLPQKNPESSIATPADVTGKSEAVAEEVKSDQRNSPQVTEKGAEEEDDWEDA